MNHSPCFRFPFIAASLLASTLQVSAAIVPTVTWDGSGDSNASGNWTTATNWSTDVVPPDNTTAIPALSTVSGTGNSRTISILNGETATAKILVFTQTEASTNILSIASGGTLNLSGAQTWDAATGGGTTKIELGGSINFAIYNSGIVAINTDFTFANAGATLNHSGGSAASAFNFGGIVNINAGVGTATMSDSVGGSMVSSFGSNSSLLINSGTLEYATTGYNGQSVAVTLNGTTAIASGAGLKLTTDSASNAGFGSAGVSLTNSATGTITQSGTFTANARGSGVSALTNAGTWKVGGTGAIIATTGRNTNVTSSFANSSGGVFTGSTASDKLDFNHLTNTAKDLAFTNSGIIAAGNGSSGSGLTSVGTLTLVDFAITNSASTSSLAFDIGGTSSGQFDVLALQSSSLALTNATLAINLVNGFTPASSFSLDILTSDAPASITGSFVGITVNGGANPDYSFAYNTTTGIGTLSYTASSIPEPSTYAVAVGVISLGLVVLRRRGKNVSG